MVQPLIKSFVGGIKHSVEIRVYNQEHPGENCVNDRVADMLYDIY